MRARVLAGALLCLLWAPATPAAGAGTGGGTPGPCEQDGVTVVVDFQDLGGDVLVRCAPGKRPRTGLEALRDAGISVEGTARWGEAFVCRVDARPALDETLRVDGDEDGYTERCVDTPPAGAYWSYWQSDGDRWVYSRTGAATAVARPGTSQGWSFALDAGSGDDAPRPRATPDGQVPRGVAWTDGTDAVSSPTATDDGSPTSMLVAVGAVAVLGACAGVGARRRRRPA